MAAIDTKNTVMSKKMLALVEHAYNQGFNKHEMVRVIEELEWQLRYMFDVEIGI